MRKLKRPDGIVVERGGAYTAHFFEDGKCIDHDSDFRGYDGKICFEYPNHGRTTRWYTERAAPRWLLAMWRDAVGGSHA